LNDLAVKLRGAKEKKFINEEIDFITMIKEGLEKEIPYPVRDGDYSAK